MAEADEQVLSRRLEAMRAQWRTLRQAHERRASSPRAALADASVLDDLQRDLEEAMINFSQSLLEWVERGHGVAWQTNQNGSTVRHTGSTGEEYPQDDLELSSEEITEHIEERIEEFSELPRIMDTNDAVEEMKRLEQWTTEEELRYMEAWPDRGRVLAIEHIAARARALQDLPPERLAFIDIGRITVMFGRMAEHLKRGWPGRAHGLARMHSPRTGSWAKDARELLDEFSIWRQRSAELSDADEEE
tara:strand:+ start:271 stop:1011 length:741 start_codon:yes stop_codon:yes gene_type:complete